MILTPKELAQQRVRLIVQRAFRDYEKLNVNERHELLLGAAEILPSAEAEEARSAAFMLQAAENQQLKFVGLIST